jgi:hypothetical protein
VPVPELAPAEVERLHPSADTAELIATLATFCGRVDIDAPRD